MWWQLPIALLTAFVGIAYCVGWLRLRSDETTRQSVSNLLSFVLGIGILLYATLFPFDQGNEIFFWKRVVQHLFLTAFVPILTMTVNPYPVFKAGLPTGARRIFGRLRPQRSLSKTILHFATSPGVAWGGFIAFFWLWHDAAFYSASLQFEWVRFVEFATLLGFSLLYWWHIVAADPHVHEPFPPFIRIFYAFAGVIPVKLVGLLLLFGKDSFIYGDTIGMKAVYFGGMELTDLGAGAMVLWVIGGSAYAYAAANLAGQWLKTEDEKPPLPRSVLESDETWKAPPIVGDPNAPIPIGWYGERAKARAEGEG